MRRYALFTLFALGCSGAAEDNPPADTGVAVDATPEDPGPYMDRSLREQVAAMESGKITSAGLTQAYLARIATRDKDIHSIIALDPTASKQASDADTKGGKLKGATILIKDNIDTKDLATTAGSIALAKNVPTKDATTVAKLRAANAVVLGKTNLSEWANFRGNRATSGWSSAGGQTNNGFNAAYNPCGSSSGSGAAVAAHLAAGALGTETDGSIVCPASMNGVVGFKPTVGLVSRAGVIPVSHVQDTVGPIARTVGDAARMMSVLAGGDPDDPATAAIPKGMSLDFEAPLASASLSGKRLGFLSFRHNVAVMTVFNAERARLEKAGATIVDVTMDLSTWRNAEFTALLYEFKFGLNAYLSLHARDGQPKTLTELIAFNDANKDTVLKYFGQEVFIASEMTTGLEADEYKTARASAQKGAGADGIDRLIAENKLDALISPTAGPAFKTDYTRGDTPGPGSSSPAAVAGYPHLTVPMGTVNELPVGMSFFGAAWSDATILALGYAYEQLPR
jgi:amidase